MFVITARFTAKAGHERDFLRRVKQQAKDSLDSEPDCKRFDVCQSLQDPRVILLYEIYTDEGAFGAHLKTPHFASFDADIKPWVDERAIERWAL